MLQTLLKIGEWQSQGKSKWDRFLDYPKVETEDRKGNPIINYTLPIIFDLDNQEVIIDKENLEEYDEEKIIRTIPVKIKGGRNKAFYTSVPAIKLVQVYKTFFGAEQNVEIESGELLEVITRDYPELLTELQALLENIFNLKDQFIELTTTTKRKNVDIRTINESFDLNPDEKIIFIVTKVISTELGIDKPILFSEIPAYKSFLEQSYFGKEEVLNNNKSISKLCYASGENVDDVKLLDLDSRYSLNKMFVTTTQNYASLFDKNQFNINYQVSAKNQEYLDYASDYLLNQGYKVRIANIDHVIIPQFLSNSKVDLEMALEGIQRKSDLLFNLKRLDAFTKNIQDWLDKEDEVFWINFVAFESDGNFFKSTEVIKDVSSFHFNKLMKAFFEIEQQFSKSNFVDWGSIMTGYDLEV